MLNLVPSLNPGSNYQKTMNKKFFFIPLITILLFALWLLPDRHGDYPLPLENLKAQVFRETVTPESLKKKLANGVLKILIVPGHDPVARGAEFGDLVEEELTRQFAGELAKQLKKQPNWRVMLARDVVTGQYQPELARYFVREYEAISSFRAQLRDRLLALISSGDVQARVVVPHNFAAEDVAFRLYGINKWANENDIDLILHIHFNDYPRKKLSKPGAYTGFSVYIPERQYPNARASRAIGSQVFAALKQYFPVSNLPLENVGLVEDQELIALGANASLDKPSILIEYGYIYEPQFRSPGTRAAVFEALAFNTIRGLNSYLQ